MINAIIFALGALFGGSVSFAALSVALAAKNSGLLDDDAQRKDDSHDTD